MVFLIQYDRKRGRKIVYEKFQDSRREEAEKRRYDIELELNRKNINHEVVILEAARESLLQKTHRRYFGSFKAILRSSGN